MGVGFGVTTGVSIFPMVSNGAKLLFGAGAGCGAGVGFGWGFGLGRFFDKPGGTRVQSKYRPGSNTKQPAKGGSGPIMR